MAERLGVTLKTRADEPSEGQRRIECVLDRLIMVYLAHTPEVLPQLHANAIASANRRYANFRQAASDMLAGGDRDGEEDRSGQAGDDE